MPCRVTLIWAVAGRAHPDATMSSPRTARLSRNSLIRWDTMKTRGEKFLIGSGLLRTSALRLHRRRLRSILPDQPAKAPLRADISKPLCRETRSFRPDIPRTGGARRLRCPAGSHVPVLRGCSNASHEGPKRTRGELCFVSRFTAQEITNWMRCRPRWFSAGSTRTRPPRA